ncbi:MAG TPA: hypothetical protein PJ988_02540 [Anaerolinea sp.]|nr:hypothetical protein [Anaerolinea sp.]
MPNDTTPPHPLSRLDDQALIQAVEALTAIDPDLARSHARHGPPPLWARPPGFATLVHIILEQQVSLASARAAYARLERTIPGILPEDLLRLDDETMKAIGFSRQKTAYMRGLAQALLGGDLDLERLAGLEDAAVRAELTRIRGIGAWTADIYLLEVLLRPDIWPGGDLALVTALQRVKGLPERPGAAQVEQIGAAWRPWRAVAARMLWHDYLQTLNPAGWGPIG